jgi:hypothetical protein
MRRTVSWRNGSRPCPTGLNEKFLQRYDAPEVVAAAQGRSVAPDVTDVPTVVCELALRSLDQQERELAELRARTNTVIAAAALIASFLGAAAIERAGGVSGWAIGALVVFGVTGGLSLLVLWPRELRFAFDARRTYDELYPLSGNVAEAQLRIAYSARDRYVENKAVIDRLELAFQAAVLTLGAQTLLWALALAVV